MSTTLVLGGVRSGKSRLAERLLADSGTVTYVATGPRADSRDAEWAERVRLHVERRPAHWDTLETHDLTRAIMSARGPLLVDCLANWVTSMVDAADAWEDPETAKATVTEHLDEVEVLWRTFPHDIVAVSNEVGSGVVPASASGRIFRDLLGTVNTRLGAASTHVYLCVGGRILDLSQCPTL